MANVPSWPASPASLGHSNGVLKYECLVKYYQYADRSGRMHDNPNQA